MVVMNLFQVETTRLTERFEMSAARQHHPTTQNHKIQKVEYTHINQRRLHSTELLLFYLNRWLT